MKIHPIQNNEQLFTQSRILTTDLHSQNKKPQSILLCPEY